MHFLVFTFFFVWKEAFNTQKNDWMSTKNQIGSVQNCKECFNLSRNYDTLFTSTKNCRRTQLFPFVWGKNSFINACGLAEFLLGFIFLVVILLSAFFVWFVSAVWSFSHREIHHTLKLIQLNCGLWKAKTTFYWRYQFLQVRHGLWYCNADDYNDGSGFLWWWCFVFACRQPFDGNVKMTKKAFHFHSHKMIHTKRCIV